ncbi:hypothetical protein GQ43DRAFT_446766 [Delitschia confertaspora ATCC 74209]|uniref:YAG7-like dimerisation domain-containing protein n=1 Tax=Delitschia confertaspora ATCC 74209 TaxID=1513339 RepID=A0A9P4MVQ0_9PLEO|nr:hypothetical protein GQ43DRAFT_446766 [Delitschia confertaspora ATCC 74209]
MSSDVGSKPQTPQPTESKSARKKKAKAEAAATGGTTIEKLTSESGTPVDSGKTNGAGDSENSYIRELQKGIRNVNKKLTLMHKVDSIIEENPGVSLDDLVASRKINADQKAQAMKKPALQNQLAQYEKELAQYKKFDQEYQQKIAQEKEILQRSHSEEVEKLRDTLKAEAAVEAKKVFREKFLTLSRFLRAAAARRQLEDDNSDLAKAFEGALLLVYGGDPSAVAAAEKLIDGSEDTVPSTEGVPLSVTYREVREAAIAEAPFAAEEAWVDDVAQSQPTAPESEAIPASTDPTVANAGLTEIDAGVTSFDGGADAEDAQDVPPAASVDAGAANAAAEEQWDKKAAGSDDPLAESFEMVPRDPAETETPHVAAPNNSTQSWAEETPERASANTPAQTGNEQFREVQQNRGRGRGGFQGEGRGGFRGRGGPRGDGRGRGRGRGDFRGRGRGGFRGDRGGPRGDAQAAQ